MKETIEYPTPLIEKARDYAFGCHDLTNHYYGDNLPYSFHLKMVYDYGVKYMHLIQGLTLRENALAACFTHDVIEDARQTYNDVRLATNEAIAEITYALTNEKGKNRKERGNDKYYSGIRATPGADFVKLCDRLANAKYSVDTASYMADLYRKEHKVFFDRLVGYSSIYEPMFDELHEILF